MNMLHRFLDTALKTVGENEIECIAGTSDIARDKHIVEMRNLDMRAFLKSGTILWQHDPNVAVGIPNSGRVDSSGMLRLGITFAPDGASEDADRVRRLVKSGIVRNLSIGFDVIDATPIDPKQPRGGLRIIRAELLEASFVSVPADVGAVVTARSFFRSGKVLSAANAEMLRDAHNHAHRAHLESQRCTGLVRRVLAAAELDEESGFIQKPQDEASRSADFRRRQRDKLMLSLSPCIGLDRAPPTLTRAQRQADARALMRSLH
jgi:HK97 family phage prohead protease